MVLKDSRRFGLWIASLAITTALNGCFSSPLLTQSARSHDWSGRWILDPTLSDDANKLIAAAAPKPIKPRAPNVPDPYAFGVPVDQDNRADDSRRGSRRSQSSADQVVIIDDNGPRLRPSDRAQFVRSIVVPSGTLQIEQQPNLWVLVQGDSRREFAPGNADAVSITDRYGSRRVRAGWSGDRFVIRSDDPRHVSIEEVVHEGALPKTLELEVTLEAWNYHKIHSRAVYRWSDGKDPLPSAGDGPPVRGVR